MKDQLGRTIEYLRLSVTQDCNLSCIYCKPGKDGTVDGRCGTLTGNHELLTPGEMETVVSVMAGLGIRKVRITGGEPLMRPDIIDIVEKISKIPGIEDLSMTTNATRLPFMAHELKNAGLKRINISLDTLRPDRFKYITGAQRLESVLEGIDKALEAGLSPVRINTVLIKGVNDDEVDSFMELTKDRQLEVRFIELMPVGSFGEHNSDKVVYNSNIIKSHTELIECEGQETGHPARYYYMPGYKGRVGFISPVSHKFCSDCNRIRFTSDGKIKPCLGSNGEVDVLKVLRHDPLTLEHEIRKTIYEKPMGHNFGKGFSSERDMNTIGG